MYKRYIGNTGRFYMVPDREDEVHMETTPPNLPEPKIPAEPNVMRQTRPRGGLFNTGGFKLPFGLEMSDVALLLIFLFLFFQSGDEEFLILLAALIFA